MAQKPDGKPAKSVAVTFTRPAAERIAHVVRTVERSGRDTKGPTWNPRMEGGGGVVFHIGTFTGDWATSAVKVVTFKYQTATPNTASVTNLFFPYPDYGTAAKDCAIAKEGTAWFLVDVPLYVATATYVTQIYTATLTYNKTATTTQITFLTGASASLNTATCDIVFTPITATAGVFSVQPTTATAMVFLSSPVTATMNYLTFTLPTP